MHCARCGEQAREGDRFCRKCGAELHRTPAEMPRLRERLSRLIGGSRRERLLTVGTAVAVVIGVAAFIALDTPNTDEEDAYISAADRVCVQAKGDLAAAGQGTVGGALRDVDEFAGDLVRITTQWRLETEALAPPASLSDPAAELTSALLEVSIRAGELIDAPTRNADRQIELAGRVDEASASVEAAIDELELDRCARLRLGAAAAGPG